MTEKKKGNGAGKFILGAALGAIAGAVAGKFMNAKKPEEKCECGDDCKCGDDCECGDNCECNKDTKKTEKKAEKK